MSDRQPDMPLRLAECFRFPVATPEGRRDVFVGGTVLLVPLVGWVLNLGHRLDVVARLAHTDPPYFRGFRPWRRTFLRGLRAFCAICLYLSPSVLLIAGAWHAREYSELSFALAAVAFVAFVLAIFSLPGGMTYNAAYDDMRYLYRPDLAFLRAVEGGRAYLWSWVIAVAAIAVSFLGLLILGIGFLYSSVWAWSVVGYSFSRALVLPGSAVRQRPD